MAPRVYQVIRGLNVGDEKLQQEGWLSEYQRKFDVLLPQIQIVEKILERTPISQFIGGMKLNMQVHAQLERVQTLHEAYALAKFNVLVLTHNNCHLPPPIDSVPPFDNRNARYGH